MYDYDEFNDMGNDKRMALGNIMDMLYTNRKAPQDYRMD